MKQKHFNLLLFMLIAACALLAVSCGVSSATNSWDETGKFLFIEIDKDATHLLFMLSGIAMLISCGFRLFLKLTYPEYNFYFTIRVLDSIVDDDIEKGAEESSALAYSRILRLGLLVARVSPVMMFWSWFIDTNAREGLYGILVILTCLALRYGTELLGINMWNFRKNWSIVWCVICVVGYIIML